MTSREFFGKIGVRRCQIYQQIEIWAKCVTQCHWFVETKPKRWILTLKSVNACRIWSNSSQNIMLAMKSCFGRILKAVIMPKKNVWLDNWAKHTICAEKGQCSKRATGTSNRKFLRSFLAYGVRQWLEGSKQAPFDWSNQAKVERNRHKHR